MLDQLLAHMALVYAGCRLHQVICKLFLAVSIAVPKESLDHKSILKDIWVLSVLIKSLAQEEHSVWLFVSPSGFIAFVRPALSLYHGSSSRGSTYSDSLHVSN